MRLSDEVRAVVHREGVIARRDHPELAGAMARLVRDRELVAVLPGVYATSATGGERVARLAALSRWAPDAVLVGRTAAQVTFWPKLPGATVECALPWARDPQLGFAFSKRRVPPELLVEWHGLRATCPDLTALDLSDQLGGDVIDQVLLKRAGTLPGLHEALRLCPSRAGNVDRRAVLLDSRDEPWSAAERLFHRLLRGAGITGWKANLPVHLRGKHYFLDVGFLALKLVIEIDGRLHQTDPELFESDRWRQNDLVLEGWTVLRFTWRMLEDHPDVVVKLVEEAICSIRSPRWR
jgi:very-short-patch-repair endonuclease